MISEVGATERDQCCLVVGVADMWKFEHFFARRRDRATAIMASRDAFKAGNMPPEKVDLSNINCHVSFSRGLHGDEMRCVRRPPQLKIRYFLKHAIATR